MINKESLNFISNRYQNIFKPDQINDLSYYYASNIKAYFNSVELSLEELKISLSAINNYYKNIHTNIEDTIISGNKIIVRMKRIVTRVKDDFQYDVDIAVINSIAQNKIINFHALCSKKEYSEVALSSVGK
ncbi:hypothetical protein [Silvanigrella aquatica]|uniref:SnoaL-like domain-containing protein n=1 Tax=Silvanigrella aquatica TaxID=1915309 RepID=A0A1L4CYV4_9BACT|nr:hypothetical protein [Silvanigrella aquatica]APJ03115.1 hypothetical protein AXG55_04005 [Silvanigrella aquatica]